MNKSFLEAKLYALKNKLKLIDYKGQKYIDGEYTETEWAVIKAERQALRTEINNIKTELNKK